MQDDFVIEVWDHCPLLKDFPAVFAEPGCKPETFWSPGGTLWKSGNPLLRSHFCQ